MSKAKNLTPCNFHSIYDNTSDQHGQMLHPLEQEPCAAPQRHRIAVRAEQLASIAAPRYGGRHLHGAEVIYNNVQPANVCQGCFTRNRFCDFQSRGPRARVRKCVACADSRCICVMAKKEEAMSDQNGNLSICQTFKCYFRQYRYAVNVLKHPSAFHRSENGQGKLREAQRIVRQFHPVSLQTLRKYVLICSYRPTETSANGPGVSFVEDRGHQPLIAASTHQPNDSNDHPCNVTKGKIQHADGSYPERMHGGVIPNHHTKTSATRAIPYLLLHNAR